MIVKVDFPLLFVGITPLLTKRVREPYYTESRQTPQLLNHIKGDTVVVKWTSIFSKVLKWSQARTQAKIIHLAVK